MKDQKELFIVEREDGVWIDAQGDGGYSCFTALAEAQDALDSEADNCEDQRTAYLIVRFVREPKPFSIPDTLPRNSCNRHVDCRKADEEARAKGATFGASHCHDEDCEDCFGC